MIKQHLRCVVCVAIAIGASACDSSRATDPLNEPLLSVDDCPETAIVECEEELGANSSMIKFLDYQDNENPYDLSLYEAPGDPRPWARGVWLGASVTPSACAAGRPDADSDGFSDLCEYKIARSFAPLMQFTMGERAIELPGGSVWNCARGEPYWAVKRFQSSDYVSIAYMPAYYADCGDAAAEVGNFLIDVAKFFILPPPVNQIEAIRDIVPDIPNAHFGDSELIRITVKYDRSSKHWVFQQAFLSAHHNTPGQSSEWVFASEVEFRAGAATFPKIWVSRNKHANYKSKSACDGGTIFNADTCEMTPWSAPYYQNRFPVRPRRNVGSPARFLVFPAYSEFLTPRNRYECFYACRQKFRGWIHTSEGRDSATPYRDMLYGKNVFEYLTLGHILYGDPGNPTGPVDEDDETCDPETAIVRCELM